MNSARRKKFGDLTIDEKVSMAENVYATSDNTLSKEAQKMFKKK
jgi:hypothetical protein